MFAGARLLIVDDEVELLEILADSLRTIGYEVETRESGSAALPSIAPGSFDALITDLNMPGMAGDELLRVARHIDPSLAMIVLTAGVDVRMAVECLKTGAHDYILKPFDLDDVAVRVGKALEQRRVAMFARQLERENDVYRAHLELRVAQQSEQLRSMFERALRSLAHALEAKDPHTRNHSERVAGISLLLAREVVQGPPEFLRSLVTAALLHDIGKIGVPEAILASPKRLTPEEFEFVKRHPEIGESILKPIYPNEVILRTVRNHHEAYDGTGYPDGLVGEAIPLPARLVAVADAYDAMTSTRPYRQAIPRSEALAILERGAGRQWDAEVVLTLVDLARDGRLDETAEKEFVLKI